MYRVELKAIIFSCLFSSNLVFLMYRVELKDKKKSGDVVVCNVPNVPCGVESSTPLISSTIFFPFLMYRVELKVMWMVMCSWVGNSS